MVRPSAACPCRPCWRNAFGMASMAQDPEVQQLRARVQMETSPHRPVSGALIVAGPCRPVVALRTSRGAYNRRVPRTVHALYRHFRDEGAWKNTETKKRSDALGSAR